MASLLPVREPVSPYPVEGRQEEEEEMKRIFKSKGVFWVFSEGEKTTPIPPFPFVWEGEAELRIRLRSTRGGNNAWWAAGEAAAAALNDAPYEPVVRAIVNSFCWAPPATVDNPYKIPFGETVPANEIWQGGSLALNFKARVVSPLPDRVREKLGELINEVEAWTYRQGSLEIGEVKLSEEEVFTLPYAGSGTRWFFNHCIRPVSRFAWRCINGIGYAIAIPFQNREVFILSPDHPTQPLQLEFIPRTAYLMRHPLPRWGTVD
jgi:hypothetical protein